MLYLFSGFIFRIIIKYGYFSQVFVSVGVTDFCIYDADLSYVF